MKNQLKEIHVHARGVIIKENHILLCKTKDLSPDFYFLPGGHVEHFESVEQALIRELNEEVGFDFTIKRFLGCLEYSYDPETTLHAKCHTHEYGFYFEAESAILTSPSLPLKQLEDHILIEWIPLSKLDAIDFKPSILRELIPLWLEKDLTHALKSDMVQINKNN